MSTYSFALKGRKGKSLYAVLPILSGILIALQLVLPAIIFASSSASGFSFGTSQALDRASVSVVRLVVSYAAAPPAPPPCQIPTTSTGLGVLVGSWASAPGSATFRNWVLTDGSLVNPEGVPCPGPGKITEPLSSIQILRSTAYTGTSSSFSFPSLQCQGKSCEGETITCQVSPGCAKGAVLVPFLTPDAQPFIDLAAVAQTTPELGVELTGSASLSPSAAQASQFLTPSPVSSPDKPNNNNELGMPIVNSMGQLVDMWTRAVDTSIPRYVSTELKPAPLQATNTNALHDAWDKGVTAYYTGDLAGAHTDFHNAGTLNTAFQALTAFQNVIASRAGGNKSSTPRTHPTAQGTFSPAGPNFNLLGISIPNSQLIWLVLLGVLILVFLLVLLSLTIVRRQARHRRELARFEEEQRMADQKAAMDAARIAEQEKAERQQAQVRQQQTVPANSIASPRLLPISDLRCPNCGQPVKATDNFCTNCRAVLSPTESGLHRRATLPPVSSPPPLVSSAPVPGVVPAAPIYDQPTKEMSPSQFRRGQEDTEKTLARATEELTTAPALSVEQFTGRNMSLAVGTRSNAGIKRQHKPNEDSLFAAQGERTYNSQPQQFGLFVVADGMGGHANGQDASRLAIQTIENQVLPRLSGNEQLTDDALVELLVDGVKEANLAVHQRNIEHRADMGTTMTAALVVGAMAYVANVGDSRTYLYRPPQGLKKITNDHSVVASLVEAGIIKPDDIYTHPKRNQIYRSLGEKPVIDVDSFKVPLQPGDKLLLCSDGLWDMVRDPTIEQVLSTVPDPSQTGNALIKAALDGGGEDNVSVIVVYINEATQRTGMTGIHLLAKPDSPQYPPM